MLVDDEDLDREILLHLSKQKIMELAEQNGQISNLIEGNYIHKLTADITVAGWGLLQQLFLVSNLVNT